MLTCPITTTTNLLGFLLLALLTLLAFTLIPLYSLYNCITDVAQYLANACIPSSDSLILPASTHPLSYEFPLPIQLYTKFLFTWLLNNVCNSYTFSHP